MESSVSCSVSCSRLRRMEPGRDSKSVAVNAVKKPSTIPQRIIQERGAPWQSAVAASRLGPTDNASRKRLKKYNNSHGSLIAVFGTINKTYIRRIIMFGRG